MSNITLFCLVKGESKEHAFVVRLDKTLFVSDLKKLIKEEKKPRFDEFAADELKLWKVSISSKDAAALKDFTADEKDELDATWAISDYFEQPPPSRHIHIIVGAPQATGRKRAFDEAMTDPTDQICADLMKPFDDIPQYAQDLVALIQAPLPQKLPVQGFLYDKIGKEHPSTLEDIQPAIGALSEVFTCALLDSTTGRAVKAGESEDMMHSPIDALLRRPLETISDRLVNNLPIEIDRNRTDDGTSTKPFCRPDFLLWLGNLLLFWGEEKAVSGAKEDLEKKVQAIDPVFFGDIQFMICYAANGSKIRFYAVDGSPEASKQVDRFIPLTPELNITNFLSRFEVLRTTINIARVLVSVKGRLPDVAYPLAKKLKSGDSTTITFNPDGVEKVILATDLPYSQANLQSRVGFLKGMYAHAKNHPGLVQVKEGPRLNRDGTTYKVTLETRGLNIRPKNENELRAMTKDLISGLAWLHEGGYLHRDIRLPNIVYDPTIKQYVIIDFEHGGRQVQKGRKGKKTAVTVTDSPFLKEWDGETLDDGVYTKASEMYQLGKLLKNSFGFLIISDQGKDFVTGLIEKTMTAKGALRDVWIRDFQ